MSELEQKPSRACWLLVGTAVVLAQLLVLWMWVVFIRWAVR